MPRFPLVADTSQSLSSKVFSKLAQKARERGGHIHPLHVGDTYREPILAARAESQRTGATPHLHTYSPVQGEPVLLDAIHQRLIERTGHEVPRGDLQVMSGATSGISVVCETLLNPGDEVLLPSPYWPLIRGIIAARGGVPVEVPVFDRLGEGFDLEAALEAAVTERTAMLYLNSPHNPTGAVLCARDLEGAIRVAERHDLWVLCDEAYMDIWFDEVAPEPIWLHPRLRPRAVVCHTLSKSYGLAGARIGYTHGPSEVMRAIRSVQTFQTYCAAKPMQYAAAAALREGHAWLDESRTLYREAAELVSTRLGIPRPRGGTFVLFDTSPYLRDEDEDAFPFLVSCLEAGVLLTPGSACGADFKKWARLCFTSAPYNEIVKAMDALAPLLARD